MGYDGIVLEDYMDISRKNNIIWIFWYVGYKLGISWNMILKKGISPINAEISLIDDRWWQKLLPIDAHINTAGATLDVKILPILDVNRKIHGFWNSSETNRSTHLHQAYWRLQTMLRKVQLKGRFTPQQQEAWQKKRVPPSSRNTGIEQRIISIFLEYDFSKKSDIRS